MDRPEEHLTQAATQQDSPDGPAAGENPFQLPPSQPPDLSLATSENVLGRIVKGAVIGAGSLFILGIAMAGTFSETQEHLVELMVSCAVLGAFLGGSIGLLGWVNSRFSLDVGKNPYRLSPKKPNDLSIGGGIAIGAGSFFLLGMGLGIWFVLRGDFSVDELIGPLVGCACLGGFVGGSIGLVGWVTSRFSK